MKSKQCVNCGKTFKPAPQATKQTYCNSMACQKERRKKWQTNKLKTDPDYKENQARAQKAWATRNHDYWRKYRESERDHEIQPAKVAQIPTKRELSNKVKMDAQSSGIPFADGLFTLKVIAPVPNVKMDSWIVEITRFDAGSKHQTTDIKR